MKKQREAISVREARHRLNQLPIAEQIETIQVNEARGRRLAENIYAPFAYPPFRRAGYDGYGLPHNTAELDNQRVYHVVATIAAGDLFQAKLKENECVKIMTGAAVPDDVLTVTKWEDTVIVDQQSIQLTYLPKKSNITLSGEEVADKELLLSKGTVLNAGAISLLAAFSVMTCQVMCQPRIAIMSTGSELIKPGHSLPAGKIYNSNHSLLKNLVEEADGQIVAECHMNDNLLAIKEKLDEWSTFCDLIITTGGVSVGDWDVLAQLAVEDDQCLFNKIKMRPGSPTTAFIYHETPVLALSGNPGACFTGFYLFGELLLRRLSGGQSDVNALTMVSQNDYERKNNYERFLRSYYRLDQQGQAQVELVGSDQSSALNNLHLANCLVEIPAFSSIKKGTEVTVWCASYK